MGIYAQKETGNARFFMSVDAFTLVKPASRLSPRCDEGGPSHVKTTALC